MGPVLSQPTLSLPFFVLLLITSTVLQSKFTLAQIDTQSEVTTPINLQELIDEVFYPPPESSSLSPNNDFDSTTEQGQCTCVPYYLCTNNQTINTDGTGLIDIRFKDGPCTNYMEMCCNHPMDINDYTTQSPSKYKETYKGCGHWNSDGIGFRITGHTNNEAQFAEFPWMMAIFTEDNSNFKFLCGGSLIHPSVVLTTYHCLQKFINDQGKLVIRAGEWDTQTELENFRHQDRFVKKIIRHEKYYGGALHNDVALVIVNEPFVLMDNVGTMCLPPQNFVFNQEKCYASGWGTDVFGKTGVYQIILKKIVLPIVPKHPCEAALKRTRLGQGFKLHESFICAGGESGKDTCKGDGGSPLMCPTPENHEKFHQAGMVAWGIGCGEDGTPGVYVNVPLFRNWIDKQMREHGFETIYYDAYYSGNYV
ncbi:phenoloxidase-activating factor 2-like [Daktulosphaira vitifoliae]|uniref:phenoloxidase-activating factor 2-like n=1 Tax=Daktulosphaira vitifoliae TaxID=58002 RepID=UPI0021AB02DD|nr:phenoloxidase-activating factor 2-like [Daktulosphaira vitifoliae]